jgi:GT2 family glycosyltransferase
MDLSFIVLTWNSKRYLANCLGSIGRAFANSALTYEVLILDNGSQDGTVDLLARLAAADPKHIYPRYYPENLGTTKSRNILLRAAKGEHLCVIDSDVELPAGVIERLIETLNEYADVGIAVPRIVYPGGAWQKSFDRFPTLLDKAHRFLRLRAIEKRQALAMNDKTEPLSVDYAISACWLLRRDLVRSVGELDERIFYAPEDVDYCLRVWKAGYRILYVPTVTIVHHAQEISRGLTINRAKLSHIRGLLYYFFKHRYLLRRPQFSSDPVERQKR